MKDHPEDTVTLTRAEYDALVEARDELGDILAFDEAMRRDEDGIPAPYVDRILGGESVLAVLREWRGFSQSGLARASGVNRVQIADIEAGRATGSVATLRKLADALNLTIDDIVP